MRPAAARQAAAAALMLAASGMLGGCSTLAPYETVPLPPKPKATDAAIPRVGICYDFLASSAAKVAAAGQDACGPGTAAKRIDTDYSLMNCPLLLPGRATFACTPKK